MYDTPDAHMALPQKRGAGSARGAGGAAERGDGGLRGEHVRRLPAVDLLHEVRHVGQAQVLQRRQRTPRGWERAGPRCS